MNRKGLRNRWAIYVEREMQEPFFVSKQDAIKLGNKIQKEKSLQEEDIVIKRIKVAKRMRGIKYGV